MPTRRTRARQPADSLGSGCRSRSGRINWRRWSARRSSASLIRLIDRYRAGAGQNWLLTAHISLYCVPPTTIGGKDMPSKQDIANRGMRLWQESRAKLLSDQLGDKPQRPVEVSKKDTVTTEKAEIFS